MNAILPDPYTIPLEELDPSHPDLFMSQEHWAYFERLRKEDPVHFVNSEEFGPYWSVTKFQDIMYVDSHHDLFSSEPSIVIGDSKIDFEPPMFIAMDQPRHDVQRGIVTPAVAPKRLTELEDVIRGRVQAVLDDLPVGESFNWVDRVSIELTTQMLATLFDFPFDERHLLTYWSDVATESPNVGATGRTESERLEILKECQHFQFPGKGNQLPATYIHHRTHIRFSIWTCRDCNLQKSHCSPSERQCAQTRNNCAHASARGMWQKILCSEPQKTCGSLYRYITYLIAP